LGKIRGIVSLSIMHAAMADPPQTNETITTAMVEEASLSLSELVTYYTYDPNMDTSSFTVSNETFAIATELRRQVNFVASALASTLNVDAPPATLCVPAYCQTAEKRSADKLSGPEAPPFEVTPSVGAESRALQSSNGASVKAFITSPVSEIAGLDPSKPVEALLFVSSGQDFAGAGSKSNLKVSGAQISFSLAQEGKELLVQGLREPIQLTAPVSEESGMIGKCTGQPDPRNQMTTLFGKEPACEETLECRYWDEANLVWSTEGCETKVYNGTDGGSFMGCECSHLSEFVSVTVPTQAFGDVHFGSIDVKDGKLTHVSGEQGGMWLAVQKNATHVPTTSATVYLAYADEATAPSGWEILSITCAQGPDPPAGVTGFSGTGSSAVTRCHWLRELNVTGDLESAMAFELTASGLAEDRGEEAYEAALTYALVYSADARREEFTVPIFTRVQAVPVAARSMRGRLPVGARCDANLTTNSSGVLRVELGREASVPFSLCDLESFPTSQPESVDPGRLVRGVLRRHGAPASSLRIATASVSFSGGSTYFIEVVPPALGSWELFVFLGEDQIPATVMITVLCPEGQVPMANGDSCGCAAGTILKAGVATLLALGRWDADEGFCEPCSDVLWSVAGADRCEHCREGYYWRGPATNGTSACASCPPSAVCEAFTTLETLQLQNNLWRLNNRTLDVWECATSGDVRRSPCVGGKQSGDETGSGYCAPGHAGPLCAVCTERDRFYHTGRMSCVDCGGSLVWMQTLLTYVLPVVVLGIAWLAGKGLVKYRPERVMQVWKRLMRIQLLAKDVAIFSRLKL
jgi:hypothetical protein